MRHSVGRVALVLGAAALFTFMANFPANAFVDKSFTAPVTTSPPAGTKVNVDADVFTYDPHSEIAVATGTVKMVYGPYTLMATRVEYNQKTGAFKANGSVELREPNGNILQATKMDLQNKFKTGFAEHVKALLNNDVTITARYARRVDGNTTVFTKATYTACKDCKTRSGNPVWAILTDQTTHDATTHNLYHVNPRLQFDGVTVVGLPYYVQPDWTVHRRTGFLLPELKFGDAYGYGITTPYFWAINPSTDLTFRPTFNTKQYVVGDVEFRQRTTAGQYNIRGYGVHQFTELGYENNQTWRGAVVSSGAFSGGPGISYGWNGTYATDDLFLNKYGFDGRYYATNDIYAADVNDQTYLSAQLLNYRDLSDSISQKDLPYAMPFVMGEKIYRDTPLGGDLKFELNSYSLHREASSTPFTTVNHATDQTRIVGQASWEREMIADSGFVVSPFAKLRSDIYITDNLPDGSGGVRSTDTTMRLLPAAGVDMRWPLMANYALGQSIVSPVFQVISAANETNADQISNEDAITVNLDHNSLFLADRFTGLDRFEGGTRSNLGLTYSFLGNNGWYVRASAGESVHLFGKNSFTSGSGLSGSRSDLVGALEVQPWGPVSLSYEIRGEENLSAIHRQEALASLNLEKFSGNIGYLNIAAEPYYGRLSREEWVEANAKYRFDSGWAVYGGAAYDIRAALMTRQSFGFEYDCDCMNFRIGYLGSRDVNTHVFSNEVQLSLTLRTLGGGQNSIKF